MVSQLLDAGADHSLVDEDGRTPLAVARYQATARAREGMLAIEPRKDEIQRGCAAVVLLLRAAGAPE